MKHLLVLCSACIFFSCSKEFPADVRIYPNPTRGNFNLMIDLQEQSEVKVYLIGGQFHAQIGPIIVPDENLILEENLNSGRHTFYINIEDRKAGTYFIETTVNGISQRTKLLKQ